MIDIIGLGPSGISRMSVGAYRVLRSAPTLFVRTARHPAVDELSTEGITFTSMDAVYETEETFDRVYARIAETILAAAESGDVAYAVPGHPLVGETAVRLVIEGARRRGIPYRITGSESFIEPMLEALEIGFDAGLKIVDALSMDTVSIDADVANLIYQVYDRATASEVKLLLMERCPDDYPIKVVSGAGGEDAQVFEIPLYELDRHDWDHLTTVYLPAGAVTDEMEPDDWES